ncbi:Multidrug resistance-like ATP-binding protein mdlB [Salmonella enterica subsp. arizonae]|uniref:Multidrug resistance-like ATP-binding protein mdlB n=1 Tax=Salmonella enterica subsp. arizonae TaxID=59203 RepID=A0A379S6G3_SALER|nr:Multidrug resistance-like ATP-binding protein mdlB [Salmonella enterica subsp. arizonae]
MRSFGQLWPTLKRLLAYGSPWRKPLSVAVIMLWIAAAAEVSGPLLISYFIDNMVAQHLLPLGKVVGLAAAYVGLQFLAAGLHYAQSLLFNQAAVGVVQTLRTKRNGCRLAPAVKRLRHAACRTINFARDKRHGSHPRFVRHGRCDGVT